MKQFGIQFGLWLLFLPIGIIAVGLGAQIHPRLEVMLFAKATQYGHTIFRITEFSTLETAPDLVTLGSSTCYRGIDPRSFTKSDLSAFNLCSSSQSFYNSSYLLQWTIQKELAPRILLLDAYPAIWMHTGIESSRDLTINNDLAFEWPFQQMAWSSGDFPTMLKASYFGVKRRFVPHRTLQGTSDTYIAGGFSYSNKAPLFTAPLCNTDSILLNRKQRKAFSAIQQTCAEEGIQLILINPPQLCEEVFERPEVMEGLPWIEGNDWPLAKVDTLYYDDHHLRGVGAELYSEWLAERVVALMD